MTERKFFIMNKVMYLCLQKIYESSIYSIRTYIKWDFAKINIFSFLLQLHFKFYCINTKRVDTILSRECLLVELNIELLRRVVYPE